MIIKPRYESLELKILMSLKLREHLQPEDESHFLNLEKGFQGELEFDEWILPFSENRLILNDLLLEHNKSLFQIDSLMISSNVINLFEVKNFEGDYYIEGDRWYSIPRFEIKNPLHQLKRNESLLRRLLQNLGANFTIEAHLVFVNSEFHLYQAPLNHPIVYPNQLNRFIDKLSKKPSFIKNTHNKLAEQLLSLHISESPYTRLPKYRYEDLKKGILCSGCGTFYKSFYRTTLECDSCGNEEEYLEAILRNVEELKMLFPELEITINLVHDWCQIIKTKKTIRKAIIKKFKLVGYANRSHYVPI